jgi:aspartate/methionine/tyrosine aminotransferase
MQKLPSYSTTSDSISVLIDRSEQQKKVLRKNLTKKSDLFKGASGRFYSGIIDAYHGETGLPLAKDAEKALQRAWNEILYKKFPADYSDDILYDKRQPLILRQLAAEKMFFRLSQSFPGVKGINVQPDDVIVCPYSSMLMIEEALATIARPGGVIVCPEGFYKSFGLFTRKLGLRIVTSRNTSDDSFKSDVEMFTKCLQNVKATGKLCGVLLTWPGNPVIRVDYSFEERMAIGKALVDIDVPIICDMAFDLLVDDYIPLAALRIPTPNGPVQLYDKILFVTGNSKGYNAFGPCKIGAACTGNAEWLQKIRDRLTISFQRETTHLVRAVIEHTANVYFEHNRALMQKQFERAYEYIENINQKFGSRIIRPLGSPRGIFLGLVFDPSFFNAVGIYTSSALEESLLRIAGIDSVALDRTGSDRLGVRLNTFAPRKAVGQEQSDLIEELFDRIEYFCKINMTIQSTKEKTHQYKIV